MSDHDGPEKARRIQCNVRLPEDLVAAIDVRRAKKDLSRDKFVERALRYALAQQPAPQPGARPNR